MPVKPEEEAVLLHLFTYHAPADAAIASMQQIREKAHELARLFLEHCPPSADRTAAIRELRNSVMTANASIVLEGRNLR